MSTIIKFPTPERAIEIENISKSILKKLSGLNGDEITFLFGHVQSEIKTHSIVVIK